MEVFASIVILLSLISLAVQDWRNRWIRPWLLVPLALGCLLLRLDVGIGPDGIRVLGLNLISSVLMIACVLLYARLKFGQLETHQTAFGLGDIVTVIVLSTAMDIPVYPIFLVVSALLAISAFFVFESHRTRGIPFVTYLSATYVIWLIISVGTSFPAPIGDRMLWTNLFLSR